MSNNVDYKMAWGFLKNTIEQIKESDGRIADSAAENSLEQHQAIGRAYMAELILEEMEYMEGGFGEL